MRVIATVIAGIFKILGYFIAGFLAVFGAKMLYYKLRDRDR